MDLIAVKGTYREMGAQQGEALRDAIRAVYAQWVEPAVKDVADDVVQAAIKPFQDKDGAHIAWIFEELRGIADGAGLPYRDVLLMNYRVWNVIGSFRNAGGNLRASSGCSAMGMRTADAGVAVGGNQDGDAPSTYRLLRRIPREGIPHLLVNWVGTVWGHNGVNAEGLGFGCTSTAGWCNDYDRFQDAMVLFSFAGERHLLQSCRTVSEALDFLTENPLMANIAMGDATGALVCTQGLGAFGTAVMDATRNGGLVYTTNNVSYPDALAALRKRGIEPELLKLNVSRLQVFERTRDRSTRTLDSFKTLLRSRENEPLCICDGVHDECGLWTTYWSTYALCEREPGVLYFAEHPIRQNEYMPFAADP